MNLLAAVGFEPTPPKRLVPKTSALDHSATLPVRLGLISLFTVSEQTLDYAHILNCIWLECRFSSKRCKFLSSTATGSSSLQGNKSLRRSDHEQVLKLNISCWTRSGALALHILITAAFIGSTVEFTFGDSSILLININCHSEHDYPPSASCGTNRTILNIVKRDTRWTRPFDDHFTLRGSRLDSSSWHEEKETCLFSCSMYKFIVINFERLSRSRGAMVARLTPDQKVACSSHVGVIRHWILWMAG